MKRRIGSNLNIGTSSLLLIFIVLSLVSFAVLSLSSALTDLNMVNQTLERSTDYYNACNAAEHTLAELNQALDTSYKAQKMTYGTHSFNVPINTTQTLTVSISTHEPDNDGYYYTITEWKVNNESVPAKDNKINLLMP